MGKFKLLSLTLLTTFIAVAPLQSAFAKENVCGKTDVVVVGAGLSGLSAARTLVKNGYSTIVLEARNRVGGRTWTVKTPDGGWVDMGAQWTGPTQDRLAALAKSLGIKTFPTYKTGKAILDYNGKISKFNSVTEFPDFSGQDMKDLQAATKKLDALAMTVPTNNPADAPNAKQLDSQTMATWINDNVKNPKVKFMLRMVILGTLASETRDVSLLHFLFYVHAGGGMDSLETNGIADRFVGGTQQISIKMAEQLGKRVKLNSPVYSIDQSKGYAVVKANNCRYIAKQVIVAIPPTLTGKIHYKPQLPANRAQFNQRVPMGSSIKVHAVYPTAFWRKKGMSGEVLSNTGPVELMVDNSPPGGKPGIIGAFFEGQAGREWATKSKAAVKKEVLKTFVKYYGPQAAKPIAFYEANWNDERYSGGCFSAVMPPGVWTDYPGAIRKPVGLIHWAGTATATRWFAYMDGAVRGGERAAHEVMQQLKKNS